MAHQLHCVFIKQVAENRVAIRCIALAPSGDVALSISDRHGSKGNHETGGISKTVGSPRLDSGLNGEGAAKIIATRYFGTCNGTESNGDKPRASRY